MCLKMQSFNCILVFSLWFILTVHAGRVQYYDRPTLLENVVGEKEFNKLQNIIQNSSLELTKISSSLLQNRRFSDVDHYDETFRQLNQSVNTNQILIGNLYDYIRKTVTDFVQNMSQWKETSMKLWHKSSFAVDLTTASDCQDLFNLGNNASGSYFLPKLGKRVLCEMETDDGGWLVIQRRAKVANQVV